MRIRAVSLVLMVAVASVLPGCGGSPNHSPQNSATAAPCTMTLSGAATATLPCMVVAVYNSSTRLTGVTITMAGTSSDIATASIAFAATPQPQSITYNEGNTTDYGGTVIRSVGAVPAAWSVTRQPKTGTISVSITGIQVGVSIIQGNGTDSTYTLHGTGTLRLDPKPESGATGSVNMSLTF